MVDTTIKKLQTFINLQRNLEKETILSIDANKTANFKSHNIIKICRICKLCDPIAMEHRSEREPNTYSRGSERIECIICTILPLPFKSSVGILPFGRITFSDHRGLYIVMNLHQFLQILTLT